MTAFFCPHWIPVHKNGTERATFLKWNPAFVKLVSVDEKPPYTEDIPATAQIVVRNHPMSEMNDQRGFRAVHDKADVDDPVVISSEYKAYFEKWHKKSVTDPNSFRSGGFHPSRAMAATLSDPAATGQAHADACLRMYQYLTGTKGVNGNRLLFEGLNEPQLWANEPPAKTAAYYVSFLKGLHAYGLHGVVGNFGVGWPGNSGAVGAPVEWAFFKPVIDLMQPTDLLGLHEYWSLQGWRQNLLWWAGRFKQCPYDVPILITECGIDTGVDGKPYGGWGDLPQNTMDGKVKAYQDDLWGYAHCCLADSRVKGAFIFTFDSA